MKEFKNTIFTLVLICSSCASINKENIAPGYVEAFKTVNSLIFGAKNENLTPELIDNIPYASSTLTIGSAAPGLIILESTVGNFDTWVSADKVFLVIENGRIIRTSGINNNLTYFASPLKGDLISADSSKFNYYYSYDKPFLVDLKVDVEVRLIGRQFVSLINQEIELTLIEEHISNDYLGWNAVNKFWIDEANFVWKSEQNISPKLPVFKIEVTKKPAK